MKRLTEYITTSLSKEELGQFIRDLRTKLKIHDKCIVVTSGIFPIAYAINDEPEAKLLALYDKFNEFVTKKLGDDLEKGVDAGWSGNTTYSIIDDSLAGIDEKFNNLKDDFIRLVKEEGLTMVDFPHTGTGAQNKNLSTDAMCIELKTAKMTGPRKASKSVVYPGIFLFL